MKRKGKVEVPLRSVRVDPAMLRELQRAYNAKVGVEREVSEHNARGQQLNVRLTEVNAVFSHVYARVEQRYKLSKRDGVNLRTGVVERNRFAASPVEA